MPLHRLGDAGQPLRHPRRAHVPGTGQVLLGLQPK